MKSNAPWSVKGIERDARETAKEAARREGLTVGEWLNQVIYSVGDPNAAPTHGEIEGLRSRDLAAAIEHLSRRIAAAESKSAAAVENLARSFGGAIERLQRLERDGPPAGGAALAARLEALESKSQDRQRIDALRALERAVSQVAAQFSSAQQATIARLDAVERQLQAAAARAGGELVSAESVREAIEGMTARIARAERIASEAASLKAEAGESIDPEFVQKTGIRLRILGDEIKRGGDQIRALEAAIGKLSQQIEAAEKRSAEGVHKVAETMAELRAQFSGAEATDQAAARAEIEAAISEITHRTEDRIQTLQDSFDAMVARLDSGRAPLGVAPERPAAALRSTPPPAAHPSEFDEAFAALELEEPIPAPVLAPAAAAAEADAPADDDEFDFDRPDAFDDEETEDVLAEIREAFGIDPARPDAGAPEDSESESPEEFEAAPMQEASLDDAFDPLEPPPLAAPPETDRPAGPADSDFVKAARLAAREAAARAAAEQAPKRKLTPKQRAILAARIKRRKLEEAKARLAAEAPVAAPARAAEPPEAGPPSVKARIAGLVAKLKSPSPAKDEPPDPFDEPARPASPNLLKGAFGALKALKSAPNAGGVFGLAGAIILLLVASFLLFRDMLGRSQPERPAAAQAAPAVSPPPVAAPTEAAVVRPRELYLENIRALKAAESDDAARAALAAIEQAAALGHPPAQLQIGELYKLGQLYERDLARARQWFERAANGGNVLAMHRLGVMAARGEGGPVDPKASIAWFERAAGFGLVDSQYNLGATFHPTPDGAAGGVQDRTKAYFWYSVAGRNGDRQAAEMAKGLAASLTPAEKSAKDAEVAAWAPAAPDPIANELEPAA
jgi:localization factor PodJL